MYTNNPKYYFWNNMENVRNFGENIYIYFLSTYIPLHIKIYNKYKKYMKIALAFLTAK